MEEYLMTARSVTQAQRMMQALSQHGIRAAMGRSPVGLTGSGCGYVLRMQGKQAEEAAALLRGIGLAPLRIYVRDGSGYSEVELCSSLTPEPRHYRSRNGCAVPCTAPQRP